MKTTYENTKLWIKFSFHRTNGCKYQPAKINNLLSGVPDYFDRNKISSGGDLSHYSSDSLY